MLAPGDYLIQQPAPTPAPADVPVAPAVPAADCNDEPMVSFLMILLRALGVMHT